MSRRLVVLVGQADPIDRLLVQVVTTIDLNRYHSHTLLEQQVGYLAGPMAKPPAEAVPMNQAKMRVRPTVAVPQYLLHPAHSMQQVVAEPGFVRPTLRPVVELGFAHPMERVVEELGFVCPTLQPVVAEQEFIPSQVFVVEELGFVCPILQPVVAEHPMYWVVDRVGSKDLLLVYFPVGSIPVVEPVVPDVANPKMPQHLLFSSFHYCERVVALRPELWLLLPGQHPL